MSDYSELKRLTAAISEGSKLQGMEAEEAMHAFECAATPNVVSELISDYERVTNNRDMWKGQCERQSEMLRLAHEADKQLKAECEGLRKDASLHAQLQRAAEVLPGAWSIDVVVEHHAGWVDVFDEGGNKVVFDGEGHLGEQVSDAIDMVLSLNKEVSNG
jgi:hypothetical protein